MAGTKVGRFLSLPVLAVIALMGVVYHSTVYVFVDNWSGLGSSAGFHNAVVFSFLALMCLASFCSAVLVDPGPVPASFAPDVEGSKGNGMQLKYCNKCSTYKPPRSHHCRVCRRCVLKMDHHCLWINNCVGYANYKPFFIFVLYASVSSIYSMVLFIGSTLQNDEKFVQRAFLKFFYYVGKLYLGLMHRSLRENWKVGYGTAITILTTILTTLLGWHVYLMSHNKTTIEYYEGIRAMWLAKKSGQSYRHFYDLGVYKNLTTILGPSVAKWFCPLALSHLTDGIHFPCYQE